MEERTTIEKRTTVVPDPMTEVEGGSVNVNVDGETGATTVQTDDPVRKTVERETTTERDTTIERDTRP
jgi:hypothetical protein